MKLRRFKFTFIGKKKGRLGEPKPCEVKYDTETVQEALGELRCDYQIDTPVIIMEMPRGGEKNG